MQMHYLTNVDLIPEKLKEIRVTVDRLCPHMPFTLHTECASEQSACPAACSLVLEPHHT
jgi:hypothetical protein